MNFRASTLILVRQPYGRVDGRGVLWALFTFSVDEVRFSCVNPALKYIWGFLIGTVDYVGLIGLTGLMRNTGLIGLTGLMDNKG